MLLRTAPTKEYFFVFPLARTVLFSLAGKKRWPDNTLLPPHNKVSTSSIMSPMALTPHIYCMDAPLPFVLEQQIGSESGIDKQPVLLAPTASRVIPLRRLLARHGLGFNVTVDSLGQWIESLWMLFGDGSTPISAEERRICLISLLGQSELGTTDGIVEAACRIAREGLPAVRVSDAQGLTALSSESVPASSGLASHSLESVSHAPMSVSPSPDSTPRPLESAPLSPMEEALAWVLESYRSWLRTHQRIEYAEMLSLLPHRIDATHWQVLGVFFLADSLTPFEREFLGALNATLLVSGSNGTLADNSEWAVDEKKSFTSRKADSNACYETHHVESVETSRAPELRELSHLLFQRSASSKPVKASGAVHIALACGPEAQLLSVHEAILDAVQGADSEQDPSIVVVLPDPLRQFTFSVPLLAQQGISCACQGSKHLCNIDVGRALIDACTLVDDAAAETALAADYSYNPFAGIWYATAFYSDKLHRGNRLIEQEELLCDLAGHAEEDLQGLIGLIEQDDLPQALSVLESYIVRHFSSQPGYAAEQFAALQYVSRVVEAALAIGKSPTQMIRHVETAQIPLAFDTDSGSQINDQIDNQIKDTSQIKGTHRVLFCTLDEAAVLEPASVHTIIAADMTAQSYPIVENVDAADTLLAKWGLVTTDNKMAASRQKFSAVLLVARNRVVMQRTMHNGLADEEQPAALFEEVLDCYRGDPTSRDSDDTATRVPISLTPFTHLSGEEHLVENTLGHAQRVASEADRPIMGSITPQARSCIVLNRRYHGHIFPGMDLSASQIESYLECPYQWFAKRRLKLESLDEGFGPAERGTFIHAVLESFYLRFQTEVQPKVTPSTLTQAREVMQAAFSQVAERQFTDRHLVGNRYVPINAWEERQRDKVFDQLLDYLEFECHLLPSFEPWKFEWAYGEDMPYSYAGCNLVGRIDRIDRDRAGRVVIIDYKSSLSSAYRLHADTSDESSTFELPAKMQALIYAKAVRDTLGCPIAAILYVNPLDASIQGAWDAHQIGLEELPFAPADARAGRIPWCNIETFDALLDRCESLVGERMANLASGEISPTPHGPDACRYCPVIDCPNRLEKRRL